MGVSKTSGTVLPGTGSDRGQEVTSPETKAVKSASGDAYEDRGDGLSIAGSDVLPRTVLTTNAASHALPLHRDVEVLPVSGLLGRRIVHFERCWRCNPDHENAIVNRLRVLDAARELIPHVSDVFAPTVTEIRSALNAVRTQGAAGAQDMAFVSDFIREEQRAFLVWRDLVTDEQEGFARTVRDQYDAVAMTEEDLECFALEYAKARFVRTESVGPNDGAETIDVSVCGPLLFRWMQSVADRLQGPLSKMRDAVELMASATPPPMSEELFLSEALHVCGTTLKLDEFHMLESQQALVQELLGHEDELPPLPLRAYAYTLFHSPDAVALRKSCRIRQWELIEELKTSLVSVAGIARRSHELLSRMWKWEPFASIGGLRAEAMREVMHEEATEELAAFVKEANQRVGALVLLKQELQEAKRLPLRMEEALLELSPLVSKNFDTHQLRRDLLSAERDQAFVDEFLPVVCRVVGEMLSERLEQERIRKVAVRTEVLILSAKQVVRRVKKIVQALQGLEESLSILQASIQMFEAHKGDVLAAYEALQRAEEKLRHLKSEHEALLVADHRKTSPFKILEDLKGSERGHADLGLSRRVEASVHSLERACFAIDAMPAQLESNQQKIRALAITLERIKSEREGNGHGGGGTAPAGGASAPPLSSGTPSASSQALPFPVGPVASVGAGMVSMGAAFTVNAATIIKPIS